MALLPFLYTTNLPIPAVRFPPLLMMASPIPFILRDTPTLTIPVSGPRNAITLFIVGAIVAFFTVGGLVHYTFCIKVSENA